MLSAHMKAHKNWWSKRVKFDENQGKTLIVSNENLSRFKIFEHAPDSMRTSELKRER